MYYKFDYKARDDKLAAEITEKEEEEEHEEKQEDEDEKVCR